MFTELISRFLKHESHTISMNNNINKPTKIETYNVRRDQIDLNLRPKLDELQKISGENVNTMRHSIDEIDEFEEAVVSKPALSPEMMVVGGNELVEADQEAWFVLE